MGRSRRRRISHSGARRRAEGGGSELSTHRHTDGADGIRTKKGALARHKYGFLAPEEMAGDPAPAEPQDCRDAPNDTMETRVSDERAAETGDQNRHRVLLTCR